jgi:hypothetical protein
LRAGEHAIDWARRRERRALAFLDTSRGSLIVLVAAMVIASVVYMWLTRGTTFWIDELYFFAGNKGFDVKYLLAAHNGQLIWFPRLIYAAVFDLFGPNYVVIRFIELAGDLLVSGLVYALVRPRIGPALALAPAILLLFFGSTWGAVLPGTGIINVYCVAAGLGAILALDRGGRFADVLASLLLLISLGCWSPGIAFAVGAGVLILFQGGGWRRLWVPAVPLFLFALWWLTKPGFEGPFYGGLDAHATNAFLIPNFAANSLSSALAAVTGLDYEFGPSPAGAGPAQSSVWGPVLALLAIFALVLALRRAPLRKWPWHWLAVLVVFWASAAIGSGPVRTPSTGRYVYVAAVVILVLAGTVAATYRRQPRTVAVILGVTVLALGANLAMLREAGSFLRSYATLARADLAGVEIARANVAPNFLPTNAAISAPLIAVTTVAGTYLTAVDRNGSFADTLPELRAAPESARAEADQVVAQADGLVLTATRAPPTSACRRVQASPEMPLTTTLNQGRTVLRATGGPGNVALRRFGSSFTAQLGTLKPDRYYALSIPTDAAPDRWWAQVTPSKAAQLTVCGP